MLLALTGLSRSADLSQLNTEGRKHMPDGVVFSPNSLAKQSRQKKSVTDFFSHLFQPKYVYAQCTLSKPMRSAQLLTEELKQNCFCTHKALQDSHF